jgi:predicted nucleotidyltransferase
MATRTMPPAIEQHRLSIQHLCRRFHVKRLELVGSAARGDFDAASSDFDFLVEFDDLGWQGSFKRYMGLKIALEELLERRVDLVQLEASTNPFFVQVVTRDRQRLYAA